MKIIVKTDEVNNFRTKIMLEMNKIDENVSKMELLKKELVWEGDSYNKLISKYDKNIKDMKDKMVSLAKCVKILDMFNNNYSKAQDEVKSNCKSVKNKKEIRYGRS